VTDGRTEILQQYRALHGCAMLMHDKTLKTF